MKTVYKYELILEKMGHQTVMMYDNAKVVHLGVKDKRIFIWAEVQTDFNQVKRRFFIAGTGEVIPSGSEYVGTVQINRYVWHVYELLFDQ